MMPDIEIKLFPESLYENVPFTSVALGSNCKSEGFAEVNLNSVPIVDVPK